MKKLFFSFVILFIASAGFAQSDILNKATSAASAAGFNVSSLTKGIMGKLSPALSLTGKQTPKVTSAVSTYLTGKSKILSLASSNKDQYTQKQSGLFSTLKTKLAGILLQNQMNKFLGLKPATNSPTNVLSQL
ncbi:MAG: hypothetical protein JST96_15225, partial [Bacteroidetes bacterium]|nr:hypothetical protein [Bacteroidota bacterium]